MQTRRATWQVWHVKAEALRVARAAELPAQQVPEVVDLITDEVLTTRCIRLTRDEAGLVEPAALRRRDGSSAYTVAGAQLYSSPEVLSAEQSLLTIRLSRLVASANLVKALGGGWRQEDLPPPVPIGGLNQPNPAPPAFPPPGR